MEPYSKFSSDVFTLLNGTIKAFYMKFLSNKKRVVALSSAQQEANSNELYTPNTIDDDEEDFAEYLQLVYNVNNIPYHIISSCWSWSWTIPHSYSQRQYATTNNNTHTFTFLSSTVTRREHHIGIIAGSSSCNPCTPQKHEHQQQRWWRRYHLISFNRRAHIDTYHIISNQQQKGIEEESV